MMKATSKFILLLLMILVPFSAHGQTADKLDIPPGFGLIVTHTAFSNAHYYRVDLNTGQRPIEDPVIVEAPNWNKKNTLYDPKLKKRKREHYGYTLIPSGEYALVSMTTSSGSHIRSSDWIWCFNQEAEVFKVEQGKINVMPPRVYRIIKNPPLDIDIDDHLGAVEKLIRSQTALIEEVKNAKSLGRIKFQAINDKHCKVSDLFNTLGQ